MPRLTHAFLTPIKRFACASAGAGGGVRAWVAAKLNGAFSSWRPPAVALDRLTIRGGLLEAHVMGEAQPRRVQDVNLTLGLGSDYKSLTLDVAGAPACLVTVTQVYRHIYSRAGWAQRPVLFAKFKQSLPIVRASGASSASPRLLWLKATNSHFM